MTISARELIRMVEDQKIRAAQETIIYDNGGETIDRYTVVLGRDVYFMSDNPTSSSGINVYAGEKKDFDSFSGEKVPLQQLPELVQKAIKARMSQ